MECRGQGLLYEAKPKVHSFRRELSCLKCGTGGILDDTCTAEFLGNTLNHAGVNVPVLVLSLCLQRSPNSLECTWRVRGT